MLAAMLKSIGVMAFLMLALTACTQSRSNDGNACGEGDAVDVNGSSFCVYRGSIVIVGGFECPSAMPFRIDFEHATVCGNHDFDDMNVPDDVCARVFVPCVTPDPRDRDGGSSHNCGDTICSIPNASARCVDGTCEIETCFAGFGDCNADPADGCETLLDTIENCGACNSVCTGLTTCSGGQCVILSR